MSLRALLLEIGAEIPAALASAPEAAPQGLFQGLAVRSWGVSTSRQMLDVTTYGSGFSQYVPGLARHTATLELDYTREASAAAVALMDRTEPFDWEFVEHGYQVRLRLHPPHEVAHRADMPEAAGAIVICAHLAEPPRVRRLGGTLAPRAPRREGRAMDLGGNEL